MWAYETAKYITLVLLLIVFLKYGKTNYYERLPQYTVYDM